MLNKYSLHYKGSLNMQLIIYVVNSEYSVKRKWLANEIQIKRISNF